MFEPRLPSPLVRLLDKRGVRLFLKRDDLIHPDIPGNKWRKLKYNLAAAQDAGHTTILTFGGAYSNHIRATAAAGHHFGFRTVGVIRGEEHLPLNEVLDYATGHGMRLRYLDRGTYRRKSDPEVITELLERFGECYVLPEGGTNALALPGCAELVSEIDIDFDVLCCACGTGGTLAGIAANLAAGQTALGFAALKGAQYLEDEVRALQLAAFGTVTDNWRIDHDFHFGGFAKRTPELDGFIDSFRRTHGIELEWVYVAKMLYGLYTHIDRGTFPTGTTIIAVITG